MKTLGSPTRNLCLVSKIDVTEKFWFAISVERELMQSRSLERPGQMLRSEKSGPRQLS